MNNEQRDAAIADLLARVEALENKHLVVTEAAKAAEPEAEDVQHEHQEG